LVDGPTQTRVVDGATYSRFLAAGQHQLSLVINTMLTSISKGQSNNEIRLVPNPTSGQATLQFSKPFEQVIFMKLLNKLGQEVQSINVLPDSKQTSIDLSNLPNGVYFLNGEGVVPLKIVKQ
jgi:hypothetical protein